MIRALVTRALGLAADLRVAQALSAGPRGSAELARERGVDADALHRVLRALASDGMFEETDPGVFRNTAASEVLARDGWDDLAHLLGGTWLQAVAALDGSERRRSRASTVMSSGMFCRAPRAARRRSSPLDDPP